jgi:hypothetical protein
MEQGRRPALGGASSCACGYPGGCAHGFSATRDVAGRGTHAGACDSTHARRSMIGRYVRQRVGRGGIRHSRGPWGGLREAKPVVHVQVVVAQGRLGK